MSSTSSMEIVDIPRGNYKNIQVPSCTDTDLLIIVGSISLGIIMGANAVFFGEEYRGVLGMTVGGLMAGAGSMGVVGIKKCVEVALQIIKR